MPRPAPARVSRRVYWRRKLDAAETPLAKFGEAADYFRAEIRRLPDQQIARLVLERETERLVSLAQQMSERRPK